jgi:type II secretory pathway component PulF
LNKEIHVNLWQALLIRQAKSALYKDRAAYYADLAMTLDDKIPLYSTLKKYENRARKKDKGRALLYKQILLNSMRGSLANSLKGIVPASELMVLNAAQTNGDDSIANGLRFLSETVEKTEKMNDIMRKSLNYPIFLLVLLAAILTGFSFYAVPVLEQIMPVSEWPPSGKVLNAVASAIRGYGVFIFGGVGLLIAGFLYSLAHWTGSFRNRLDRHLPYSLYRDYSGALLIVSLASMMQAGVSLRSALQQSLRYTTPWMEWHVKQILRRLSSKDAAKFGYAFATGILSTDLEERIADASERRDPVVAFVRIGLGSIDRVGKSIAQSAEKINTIMLLVCGLSLGAMMMGFMATTQELNGAVKRQIHSVGR